jgi:hypothetical protein
MKSVDLVVLGEVALAAILAGVDKIPRTVLLETGGTVVHNYSNVYSKRQVTCVGDRQTRSTRRETDKS